MFNAFLAALIPLLLVVGLYHLVSWFNVFHLNERPDWKRVGLPAAIADSIDNTVRRKLLLQRQLRGGKNSRNDDVVRRIKGFDKGLLEYPTPAGLRSRSVPIDRSWHCAVRAVPVR